MRTTWGRDIAVSSDAVQEALRTTPTPWPQEFAPTLDHWLTNPSALVPGTKMFFQISDPQSRADVIAFLEEQK